MRREDVTLGLLIGNMAMLLVVALGFAGAAFTIKREMGMLNVTVDERLKGMEERAKIRDNSRTTLEVQHLRFARDVFVLLSRLCARQGISTDTGTRYPSD